MDPQQALAQGRHLIGLGRFADAVRLLQQAAYHRPEWPDVQHQLALALSLAGEPLRAESHLQRALELHPDYAEAHLNLAILLFERGAYQVAREHLRAFDRLVHKSGGHLPEAALDDLAQRHAALAERYKSYGLLDEAEEEMRRALRLCPGYGDWRLRLARLLFERGQFAAAGEQLELVLRARPELDEARLLQGRLASAQGDTEAARAAWKLVRDGSAAAQARALLDALEESRPAARWVAGGDDDLSWGAR
ncbi:MAG TPA: tetratricopeptide repeat protein [Candidatus Krumholzibacteria bacterium]|nr:tetratricopeptide repeat protein [Candidatus Krumholzibacteria bacterium]